MGRLDILVNNAGYGVIEPFLAMTGKLWKRTLALNVTALAMACTAAGRVMRDQRSGRIVNITSPASRMALPNYTAYAASKAGVDSITRAAAVALAPFGVLVNSVAPGHDGHRDAALDRGRAGAARGAQRPAGLPRRAHAPHAARPARRARRGRGRRRLARARRARLHDRRAPQLSAAASTRTEPMARSNFPSDNPDIACAEGARHEPPPPHAAHGARPGAGLYRPGARHRRRAGRALLPRAALRSRRPRLGGPRPLPAVDRPLLDRALGGAGRMRHHPGRRSSPPTAPTTAGWT